MRSRMYAVSFSASFSFSCPGSEPVYGAGIRFKVLDAAVQFLQSFLLQHLFPASGNRFLVLTPMAASVPGLSPAPW